MYKESRCPYTYINDVCLQPLDLVKKVTDSRHSLVSYLCPKMKQVFDRCLALSLPMTTQEAFADSADQDQTAHNVQSHL